MCFGSKDKVQDGNPPKVENLKSGKVGQQKRSPSGRLKNPKPNLVERNENKTFKKISETGPIPKRSCTDLPCCILLIGFWVFQVYYSIWAYTKGDPWKLAQPFDLDGNACGDPGTNVADYKYAYFFNPFVDLSGAVCLEKCPTWILGDTPPTSLGKTYLGILTSAKLGLGGGNAVGKTELTSTQFADFNGALTGLKNLFLNDPKALVYNTTTLLDRYCVPDLANLADTAKSYYQTILKGTDIGDTVEEYISDLKNSYMIIIYSAIGAIIVCLIYMFFLQFCVGVVVWIMILMFLIVLVLMAIFFHRKSTFYKNIYDKTQNKTYKTSQDKFYYAAIFIDVMIFLFVCLLCCYMTTIELCIAVLKSAAIFMRKNFCIILVPLIMTIIIIAYSVYWAITLIYIWSIGGIKKRANLPVGQITWDAQTRATVYAHGFSLFWVGSVFLYYGQFVIILATALWYFNHDTGTNKTTYKGPIRKAVVWAMIYHLGSIAFAAFILAVVIVMRIIMYYVQWQVEKVSKRKGKKPSCGLRFMFACLHCTLACAERVVKQINKSGFMSIALKSQNFCTSCAEGFLLMLRNPLKFGVLAFLGEIFVFIGKVFIGCVTAGVGFIIIDNFEPYTKTLYSPLLPTFCFFINGLLIGSIFMSVFGLSADTIMFCYFVEKEGQKNHTDMNCPAPMKKFFLDNKSSSSEDERVKEASGYK